MSIYKSHPYVVKNLFPDFLLQDIEVLTDIFVAWGRQAGWAASALSRHFVRRRFGRKAEKRYPLSELEIVKWGPQVLRMLWFLQIRVRILMLTPALGKGTLTQSAGKSEGSGQTRSFLEQNAWSVVLSAKSLSYSLFLCICFYLFLSLLISFYPGRSWFWNVWIGIDRTNYSTPRFCGIDSNLGDLFRLDCRCCVVKASLVSWDSNTSTLKQMTRRMATWGEWGAGSFWQSRVWTAHGCLWQAVQARLVDTHAFRFICHIFGGICVFFFDYYLRLTGMVRSNEKMKLQDLKMLKVWFLFDCYV